MPELPAPQRPLSANWPTRFVLLATVALVIVLGISAVYRAGPYQWGDKTWGSRMHRTDFTIYTAVGKAILDGRNIYEVENPRHWHYNNSPLFGLLFVPLALMPLMAAVILWYLLSLAAVVAATRWSVALAESEGTVHMRFWLYAVPPLLLAWPLMSALARGQTTPLLFGLIMAALYFESKDRPGIGGAALAGAILLKVFPGLLLLYYVWKRRWWFVAATLVAVICGLLLPALAVGWEKNVAYHKQWVGILQKASTDSESDDDPRHGELNSLMLIRNQSLQAIGARLTGNEQARWLGAGVGLAMLAAMVWVGRRTRAGVDVRCLAAMLCWMLLVSPVSWAHYFMINVLPLALLTRLAAEDGAAPTRRWAWAALIGFALLGAAGINRKLHFFGPLCWATSLTWLAIVVAAARQGRANAGETAAR